MSGSGLPAVLPPGSWLGLLGGGQLGRLFCMAAQSLGYRVCVIDPAEHSPAGSVADHHLRADYLDVAALDALAGRCAAVTTEFENVPAAALERLAARVRVTPSAAAVAIAQDRVAEKRYIASCGLSVAPWQPLASAAEASACRADLLPGILKVARLGYDGKGQARVDTPADVAAAFAHFDGAVCVLERRLDLAYEVSVIVARGVDGRAVDYPVVRNVHRDGILSVTVAPADLAGRPGAEAGVERLAAAAARRLADGMDYHGVLCVEFFVLADGSLCVNEMAPRPHNSGHVTLDASVTSQFEQQARVMAGLPLGDTAALCPAVMLNILGDAWFDPASGARREPDWAAMLSLPRARLHLYGKDAPRRGRKMGHLTVLADDAEAARHAAEALAPLVAQPARW